MTFGFICGECGSKDVHTTCEPHAFVAGGGPRVSDAILLATIIPVRHCNKCGFEWWDDVAGDIIDRETKEQHFKTKGETL